MTPEDIERFWSNVIKRSDEECWPYRKDDSGYHTFTYSDKKTEAAHRIAYRLAKGEIAPGRLVRHLCNNPPCCNPAHLAQGTQGDNMRDMSMKRIAYTQKLNNGEVDFSGRDLITVEEAAFICKTHPETIRRWLKKGAVRGIKVGHIMRIHMDSLNGTKTDG